MSADAASHSPALEATHIADFLQPDDDDETASQRSISLSSPAVSARNSTAGNIYASARDSTTFSKRDSHPYTLSSDLSSEVDERSSVATGAQRSSTSTANTSVEEEPTTSAQEEKPYTPPTYPPTPPSRDDAVSIRSTGSSSRKARPESMIVLPGGGPIILGIALVDFNHLVGPKIEYSRGDIFEDEEVAKILPFLALPDGAHLSAEDYSYFHLVPSGPKPTTVFGISCNQQIAASALLVKMPDVVRSTVQKAVVVLASKPIFGPIRDKLGVVTTALFNQRDFTDLSILDAFGESLEASIRSQMTESGLLMGTSLRELVHKFRQRTLVLVKTLILQKRIMFSGYPVERLCTYQYSLISLIPGLLQTLEDCGSPPIAARAPTLSKPTSLKTSDRKSMMAYLGFPLDIFGKDSFFQPYIPLQQLDMLKDTPTWLCGSTNSIVTQQSCVDLLVNTDTGVFEFRNPNLERLVALTPADRKWMDGIVQAVNESWLESEEDQLRPAMQFKGSDDYLRVQFEEYISSMLASLRYQDFVAKEGAPIAAPGTPDATPWMDFNPLWLQEFRGTNAYELWERTTDSSLFDIVEPRHPCVDKPSVVADIGLRLSEGIQEMKLDQQLAPAREAVTRTLASSSTNFLNAVAGVRERWNARPSAPPSPNPGASSSDLTATPEEVTKEDAEGSDARPPLANRTSSSSSTGTRTSLSGWGAFLSSKAPRFSFGKGQEGAEGPAATSPTGPDGEPTAVDLVQSPTKETSKGSVDIKSPVSGRFSFFTRASSTSSAASVKSTSSMDAVKSVASVDAAAKPLSPPTSGPPSPATPVAPLPTEKPEVKAEPEPATVGTPKEDAKPAHDEVKPAHDDHKADSKHDDEEEEGAYTGMAM
ncbi:transport protein Avl9-domain-containing protein [Schizophyllum commune]